MDQADALGKPGEGIHTHVFGVAMADVVMTGLAAKWIANQTQRPVGFVFAGLIVLGVLAHHYFGVETTLNKALGLA